MSIRLKPMAALLPLAFITPSQAAELLAALDPVVVTASRQPMRASEVLSDITIIERKEIESAGQSSLEELLARQPGIEFASNGGFGSNSSIFTRGSNSQHTLLLVDGMRVGSITTGDATWSRIPTSQIERIEIVRGPASSLYGSDALGGVIQVFTRQGDGPLAFYGEAGGGSFGTYSASTGFSGSQNGWRYALNASTFQTQGINNKPKATGTDRDRDGFWNNSLGGRLSYAITPDHEAGITFLASDGESEFDSGGNDRNKTNVASGNAYLKSRLTDSWGSTLSLGYSQDKSRNLGTLSTLYETEQKLYSWQNDFKTGIGKFLLGFERLEQDVDSTTLYKVKSRTNDSVQIGWLGSYEAHRLQASARYEDNSQFGDKTTGNIAYGYRFNEHWRANFGYGTAFRAPSFNNLYWPFANYGAYGTYQGNPDLQPEFARNREASIHYEAGRQHVSLTYFQNRVHNLISSSGGFNNMPINVGNARLEGWTLAYDGQIGNFLLAANYNHQNPRDTDNNLILARRAKDFGNLSLGQEIGAWEYRVELQANGERFDDAKNLKKLDGYTLTNLYGAYRFTRDWSVFARVNNLFDKDYVLADGYATPGINAFVGIRYNPK